MTDQMTAPRVHTRQSDGEEGFGLPAGTAPRRRWQPPKEVNRTVSSPAARRTVRGRITYWTIFGLLAGGLLLIAIGPLYWLFTGSLKSTHELLQTPPTLIPTRFEWENFVYAWQRVDLPRYLINTIVLAAGTLVAQLVVAVTCAYALSVLKPPGAKIWYGMVVATLFLPHAILFIPTYVTVVDLGLINTPFAVWLPHAASAFNIFLLKRFFDRIPPELIDAARVDGAGPWQVLRHVVLPMSKSILAVIAIFSVTASWKDFLWPLITLPDPAKQPLSVALANLELSVELKYVLAGLVIASIPPIILFLVFQKRIVGGLADAGINR